MRSGGVPLVALVVLDGWGLAPPGPGNAVEQAATPVFDDLWARYPHTTLEASGHAVGLPEGQMGNSEVGHLTIGSGRVVYQDLVRINRAIEDGSFMENEALVAAFRRAKERGGNVHLLGLVSYGGVHSHIDHLRALLDLAWREGMDERTYVHAFTDGRDVSPTSALKDIGELVEERAQIATVVGRYYAMDRDQRWDRTELALAAITEAGPNAEDPLAAIDASYAAGVTDEFIEPIVLATPRLGPDDAAIFFNFRPDRTRQLSQKLLELKTDLTTMTRYREDFPFPVAFDEQTVSETMAEVLAEHGARQLHVAETEKYAHVTYFFNGGEEKEWEGETRILVPVAARCPDLRPEAGDVRRRGGRPLLRRDRERLPVRDRQLREPGHGRPHGLDPGRGEGGRDRRRVPRSRGRRGPRGRRSLPRHGRPRERRAAPRGRRHEPAYRAHAQSCAARHDRRRR